MDFIILTPDGVGSTILQRLITLTYYLENVPVRNTHELTNGIELDSNNVLKKNFELRYSQTLPQIIQTLKNSNNTCKYISRVAKYHLDNRGDAIVEQKKFYEFLNNNFKYKIKCVRKNIFEYALSWSIRNESGMLNVFNRDEKMQVRKVKQVNEDFFLKKCKEYAEYVKWVDTEFPDTIEVAYEDLVLQSDQILADLTGYQNTFTKKFGEKLSTLLKNEYEYVNFGKCKNVTDYKKLYNYKSTVEKLQEKAVIINHPIKNTTLTEKKNQIANYDNCVDKFKNFARNYNWIDQANINYDFWNKCDVNTDS